MKPDLILHSGTFFTLDRHQPTANAVAICGQKICGLGNNSDVLAMAGPTTRKVDLAGKLVLPGFIDSHLHFYEWALNYDSIDFSKTSGFGAMEDAVRAKAVDLGAGQWVLGQGFNESDWPENRIPDRKDLDLVAPDNPVCIWRCDLHLGVANSMALSMAGIDSTTPNPLNGVIVKDASGMPTGVLKELALNRIREAIPELSEDKILKNMQKAIVHAHGLGLTGVHDIRLMGGEEGAAALQTWQTLHALGQLNIRCHVALPGEMTDQAVALGLHTGFGDDLLAIGHLKFFADGGMGARTAWLTEKYLDAEYGMPLTPIAEIEAAVTKADQAGLSCMVHAVGDRTSREVIDMFTRVEMRNHSSCLLPHRIEHVQMIQPEDLEKLSRMKNLALSCQPNNMSLDISMIDQCLGPRGRYTYSLKSLLNSGIPLMLSSDAPVADPNPFAGIYSAVTRKRMDGTPVEGWYKKQALDVSEAIRAYTLTPAQASGCDQTRGSISMGKYADMVVANRNIFTILSDDIAETKVEITIFNGEIVYEGDK